MLAVELTNVHAHTAGERTRKNETEKSRGWVDKRKGISNRQSEESILWTTCYIQIKGILTCRYFFICMGKRYIKCQRMKSGQTQPHTHTHDKPTNRENELCAAYMYDGKTYHFILCE